MSGIIKVFLLLAVVACISKAQLNKASQSCLCQRVRNGIDSKFETKDVQFYPATSFCNRVEVIITSGNGYRYCLNPELKAVKNMITRFLNKNSSKPTRVTITSSTSTTPSSTTGTSSISSTTSTTGSWCLAE